MRLDKLRRGFWGYKKDSVYHYIVSLEEKASERVAEKEAKLERLEAEMEQRLAELESAHKKQVSELEGALNALRKENIALQGNQAAVFSTMLEAQKYAEQLRADSVHQKQQAQEKLSAAVRQKARKLDDYQGRIQQLRAVIRELLKEFDGKAEEVERALAVLTVQAPGTELDGEVPGIVVMPDAGGTPGVGEIPAAGQ